MNNVNTPQQVNNQGMNNNQVQGQNPPQNINNQQSRNTKEPLTFKKLIGSPASIFLRVGLALVFLYAAFFVSDYSNGAQYVPVFVTNFISIDLFLRIFGAVEVLLAFWLLLGIFPRYAGLVSAVLLVGVTAANLEYFGALFRNVAIICAALALYFTKDS